MSEVTPGGHIAMATGADPGEIGGSRRLLPSGVRGSRTLAQVLANAGAQSVQKCPICEAAREVRKSGATESGSRSSASASIVCATDVARASRA